MQRTLVLAAAALALVCLPGVTEAELLFGLSTTNNLLRFDSATPGTVISVPITGTVGTLTGIDFRPATGQLYSLNTAGQLYIINPLTGVAATGPALSADGTDASLPYSGIVGTAFGFDFNPVPDRLRFVSDADQNLRINVGTGATITDTVLAFAVPGSDPNIVGSAYTNNFAGATTTTLYGIDSNQDFLVTQNPPNNGTLNVVGVLGFNTSDLVGFDISGLTGIAYASLTAPGGNNSQLFTINLGTGAATLIGTIGGGVPLQGLTAAPVPEPSTLTLFALGLTAAGLRRWRRR